MPTTVSIDDLSGGLSLVDPLNIEDNQFEVCTNMFYNSSKRLQTRKGYEKFSTVPDTVALIDACDATTDWTASLDATNVTAGDAIRGTNSVSFDVDVSLNVANQALLTKSTISADITNTKGYVGMWVKFPTDYTTDLTNIKVRMGSDSSNYYEWTITNPSAGTNTFLRLNFSDASTTGTPVDATITEFVLEINYGAGYTDKSGWIIDDIRTYSSTSVTPITSMFYFQNDVTLERTLLSVAGSNMFYYVEASDSWNQIESGLIEFETDYPTKRTRWSFVAFKNVVYMCNGIDAYKSWDGTKISEPGIGFKPRYLEAMGLRVYASGNDLSPNTLYYTDGDPANANAFGNAVPIGFDGEGRINAMKEFGSFILIFKSERVFSISHDATSGLAIPTAIDTQNGGFGQRIAKNVENGMLYFTKRGIDNLQQRGGVTGAGALASESYTSDLKSLLSEVNVNDYNAGTAHYSKGLTNYYFSFDTGNDDKPDTTLVMSSLLGKSWTKYTFPAMYDYSSYKNSSGELEILMCSANTGTIYSVERGFDDNTNSIPCEIKTKKYDFGDFSLKKSFQTLDIVGLKSKGKNISVQATVDDDYVIAEGFVTDDNIVNDVPTGTVGTSAIGVEQLTGPESDTDVPLYAYRARLALPLINGSTFQVKMTSDEKVFIWTLDHMKVTFDQLDTDVFDLDKYI